MRLVLAPMEGLADVYLRRLITAQGGFDWAVTEFVRVVDQTLPERVFWHRCPELLDDGKTRTGTPVRVQLLGNHPQAMADNAARALSLGSFGIDINFGCPSKTVNRSKGGAILLKEPDSLYRIMSQVRQAVPAGVILSAKMRLGYEDATLMSENAAAIEAAGADELTVHARTKVQGYQPPAHWHHLKALRKQLRIPLIANGDIWTPEDYRECARLSGCPDAMLGRGAIRQPDLASRIKTSRKDGLSWSELRTLILGFWLEINNQMPRRYCAGRLKQWLNHLRQVHSPAEQLWQQLRTVNDPTEIRHRIARSGGD